MTVTFMKLNPEGDPKTGMGPSDMVPVEAFTTADKTESIHTAHSGTDGKLTVGTWECAPCREEIESYPVDEMMTVISGSVTLTDPAGRAETYRAGDTFFVPKGTPCVWEITETLRKFYMIVE